MSLDTHQLHFTEKLQPWNGRADLREGENGIIVSGRTELVIPLGRFSIKSYKSIQENYSIDSAFFDLVVGMAVTLRYLL